MVDTQVGLATIFGIPPENVHLQSPYVSGGFDGKATILSFTLLAAIASEIFGRVVKLAVPREAMFTAGSFRPVTRTRVALGAQPDGRLTYIIFEEAAQCAEIDDVAIPGSPVIARMYNSQTLRTNQATVATDVNTPRIQRAFAEASSFFGFESAVDELAVALDMDPIALRLKNEPTVDPVTSVPWSSRSLVQCCRRGAEIFGRDEHSRTPGTARTPGGLLRSLSYATASYPSLMRSASARVTLRADGTLHIASAAHDLGQGAYTVLGQIAANVFGVADESVRVALGDSGLPAAPMAGGSLTTGAVGSAVLLASRAMRDRLLASAVAPDIPFAGLDPESLNLAGGCVIGPDGRSCAITTILDHGLCDIEETAEWKTDAMDVKAMRFGLVGGMATNGPATVTHATYSFGAQFAEVHISTLVRTIKVARMVGVFACGKIINPRTAGSNLAGGMIWAQASPCWRKAGSIGGMRPSPRKISPVIISQAPPITVTSRSRPSMRRISRSMPSARRLSARSGSLVCRPRSPTHSTTRPASAYARRRSSWKTCSDMMVMTRTMKLNLERAVSLDRVRLEKRFRPEMVTTRMTPIVIVCGNIAGAEPTRFDPTVCASMPMNGTKPGERAAAALRCLAAIVQSASRW